ncbi:MAG: nuclear transport factor 2 family protein [Myxococcales bacterium]|nr:nuclear transport factor 2 family protein [Myxococcales bacterium]
MKTPTEVAQAQLDAYNAQDLDAHVAYFGDDVRVADLNGAVTIEGIEAYRARYAKVFAEFPENKAVLVNRITIGNVVIDHERVSRSPSATPFEVAAIYTISDGKIRRVDFVK